MADLPQSFLDSMKEILGEDYEAFLAGFDGQRQYGLRVNTLSAGAKRHDSGGEVSGGTGGESSGSVCGTGREGNGTWSSLTGRRPSGGK